MGNKKDYRIEGLVGKVTSDFYYISGKKKYFWQSTSEEISCRVRNKNHFNKEYDVLTNVRAFLLDEDKRFFNSIKITMQVLKEKDRKQVEQYILSVEKIESGLKEEQIKENIGVYAMNFPEDELKSALDLKYVISCTILGYEKEFFKLKCYSLGYLPDFILRALYHTKYDHSEFGIKSDIKLTEPLELEYMLKKITFS